jgi:serine/threonine protein kinase
LALEPGTVVAKRYKVRERLGKGGMGEVFSAENMRTGRMVAIKVLRAESKAKQSAIERFRREARAAGSIDSDFVTQVLDVEDDEDHGIVLVFELLEGESLVERLKRTGPIGYDELWGIVEAVWMGLADAHAAGIVHRDLKPSNVFLEHRRSGRRVKILDFGISKLPKTISTDSLTQVGQSLGTFSFMPPEQIGKAKSVDHRADVYACTTLVYQALSGKLPYKARNVVAMMELKNKSEPRTMSEVMNEPVSAELEAFIARGLARNPDDRFQTAVEALAAWRKLRPPSAMSVLDLDASGAYPLLDEPSPSSEAKTLLLQRPSPSEILAEAQRRGQDFAPPEAEPTDGIPATLRDVGLSATTQPANGPHSGLLPDSTTEPDLGQMQALGMPQPQAISQPLPQIMPEDLRASAPSDAYPVPQPPYVADESLSPPPMNRGIPTAVALTVGALALMVVGFLAVAIILHLVE